MSPRVPVFNKHIAVDLTVSGKFCVMQIFIDIYCVLSFNFNCIKRLHFVCFSLVAAIGCSLHNFASIRQCHGQRRCEGTCLQHFPDHVYSPDFQQTYDFCGHHTFQVRRVQLDNSVLNGMVIDEIM